MFRTRLRIEKDKEDTKYINIMTSASQYSNSAMKTDYSIVESNRYKGMLKGIGLMNAGRELTFTIPLFEIQRIDSEKDIYKLIANWTSMLVNSYSYRFYIEQFIDNAWWSAQIVISGVGGYTVDRVNYVKSFSVSYILLDNFYTGELVNDKTDLKGSGNLTLNYNSQSLVASPLMFECVLQSNLKTLNFQILHKDNYGIVLNEYLGGGTYTISFNGEQIEKKSGTDTDVEGIIVNWEGVQPFLNIGHNEFTIISNYNIVSFTIKYYKGIAL